MSPRLRYDLIKRDESISYGKKGPLKHDGKVIASDQSRFFQVVELEVTRILHFRLGRSVHNHELFGIFSLANQN